MSATPDPARLERLLAAFASLPPHEAAALEVLAVLRTPVARSHVLNVLRRLGVTRDAQKKSLDSGRMLTALEHLRALGLVGGDHMFTCDRALARALVGRMRASGRFDALVATVRDAAVPLGDADRLWIALLAGDFAAATAVLAPHARVILPMLDDFDDRDLAAWPDPLVADVMGAALGASVLELRPFEDTFASLERLVAAGRDGEEIRLCLGAWRLLRGDVAGAEACLVGVRSPRAKALLGGAALARNDVAAAARLLAEAPAPTAAAGVESLAVLWRAAVFFHQGDFRGARALLDGAQRRLASAWERALVAPLDVVVRVGLAEIQQDDWDVRELSYWSEASSPFARFVRLLAGWWAAPGAVADRRTELGRLRGELEACGLRWPASTLTEMDARATGKAAPSDDALLDAMRQTPAWQRALTALERLLGEAVAAAPAPRAEPPRAPAEPTSRVAWVLTLGPARVDLQPVEQRPQAGGWSKGRPIALERLSRLDPKLPLTDIDRRVIACITSTTYRHRGYPEVSWSIDTATALEALVDHPHVFLAGDPPSPVGMTRGEPTLEVIEAPGEVVLRFSPRLHVGFSYAVGRDSPLTLRVVRVPEALAPYIPVIGEGIRVPRAERARIDRLVPLLSWVAKVRFGVEPAGGG